MPSKTLPAFRPLTGIYEPSAIQQLADGRFLVVEDEQQHPFSLVSIDMAGEVDSTLLEHNTKNETASFWKLNDLKNRYQKK